MNLCFKFIGKTTAQDNFVNLGPCLYHSLVISFELRFDFKTGISKLLFFCSAVFKQLNQVIYFPILRFGKHAAAVHNFRIYIDSIFKKPFYHF